MPPMFLGVIDDVMIVWMGDGGDRMMLHSSARLGLRASCANPRAEEQKPVVSCSLIVRLSLKRRKWWGTGVKR